MTQPSPQPDVTYSGTVVGNTVIAQLPPKGYDRQIERIVIVGPQGSQFDIYVGMILNTCRRSTTTRGDNNQADFSNPIPIPAGNITYFVWSGYSAIAPASVTIGYSRV